MKNNSDNK